MSTTWETKKIIMTAGMMVLSKITVPFLNVFIVLMIARWQGPAPLGQYTFLLTLFLLFENLKTLGLNTLVVRQISRNNDLAERYHASLLHIGRFGALISAFAMMGLILITYGVHLSFIAAGVILCSALFPSALVFANEAVFLSTGRVDLILKVNLYESLARVVLSTSVLFMGGGVVTIVCIYAFLRWVAAIFGKRILKKYFAFEFIPHHSLLTRSLLRHSTHFLPIFALPLILFRMDVIFLAIMTSDHEVGLYGAAMRFFTIAMIVPDGVLSACFPPLAKFSQFNDQTLFKALIRKTTYSVGATLTSLIGLGLLLSPWVIKHLFGDQFFESQYLFVVLLFSLVPITYNRIIGDVLVVLGQQKHVALAILLGTCFSFMIYPVFIRFFGMPGAAWGFLLSSTVLMSISGVQAIRVKSAIPLLPMLYELIPFIILLFIMLSTRHKNLPDWAFVMIILAIASAWGLFFKCAAVNNHNTKGQ